MDTTRAHRSGLPLSVTVQAVPGYEQEEAKKRTMSAWLQVFSRT
jgi:hypothetical protein